MDDSYKAIRALLNSIETVVSHYVNNAKFDKTKPARIKSILENGKYKVDIQGMEYSIPSSINMNFSVGDFVWVLIPCGDISGAHITGKR